MAEILLRIIPGNVVGEISLDTLEQKAGKDPQGNTYRNITVQQVQIDGVIIDGGTDYVRIRLQSPTRGDLVNTLIRRKEAERAAHFILGLPPEDVGS